MSTEINLISTLHSNPGYQKRFDGLIGIDEQKKDLLFALRLILDGNCIKKWQKQHHPKGLPFLDRYATKSPLVILSGEVGSGKTELALSIGSPLSDALGGETIRVFESPSNIRAGGYVGDISKRIVETFKDAKLKLKKGEFGVLIIDEADDLATNREQMQAHHEDRAGVNVLIKEIDNLQKEMIPMAVIMITNRGDSLDPAVLRRSSAQIHFGRPNKETISALLSAILEGSGTSQIEIEELVSLCLEKQPGFTSSDLIRKVGENALRRALQEDMPLNPNLLKDVIQETNPSPTFQRNQL